MQIIGDLEDPAVHVHQLNHRHVFALVSDKVFVQDFVKYPHDFDDLILVESIIRH